MNVNKFTLSFAGNQEKQYQDYFFRESLPIFRISFILLTVLYSLFAFTDLMVVPEYQSFFFFIRFGIVVPVLCLVFLLSYTGFFKNVWQLLLFFSFIVGGAGIVVMILLVPDNMAYYAGLMLVFMAGYFFIRLRFFLATLAGWLLWLLFNLGLFLLSDAAYSLIITHNFFYIAANFIGMVAAYHIELNHRRNFQLLGQLDQKKEELEQINEYLEDEINQRTTDLVKSEKKFRNLVEEVNDVIFLLNSDGLIEYMSPVIEQLTGFKSAYYIQKPYSALAHPGQDKQLISTFDAVENGENFSHEFKIFARFRNECWVRSSLNPIIEDQRKKGFRGIIQDITRQKNDEVQLRTALHRAEAGDRLKTAFLNNISHEIRTPLNGILGFGQLITHASLTHQERIEYLQILQKSSDRLIDTINNYMDMSMIASDTLQVNIQQVSIPQFLVEMHSVACDLADNKALEVLLDIPETKSRISVLSDPELLNKAMRHLILNAVKFTRQGKISIGYRYNAKTIELFVKDTGVGISPDALERIFVAFAQEEDTSSREYEGSGLGLSIAAGIIAKLGGKIHVETQKGKGSAFYLSLAYTDKPETTAENLIGPQPLPSSTNFQVLVAGHEEPNFLYIEKVLRKVSVDVLRAANGMEAVEICKKNPWIGLVIMDVNLPVMNGIEATRLIKEYKQQLPVIIILSYAGSHELKLAEEAGCDMHLSKPLVRDELLKTVVGFL